MKVRIVKCTIKNAWYKNLIGQEIDVTPNGYKEYYVCTDEENVKYNTPYEQEIGVVCTIEKTDCEVIEQ